MGFKNTRNSFGRLVLILWAVSGALVLGSNEALAQRYASQSRMEVAKGHYARARAMLVEALAEFEQGRKLAQPDMLLDSEEWRISVVSRTEELNRLLDPQPRVTRHGARFRGNPLLIRRERDRLPVVREGARDTNTYEEEKRQSEADQLRARMKDVSETPTWSEPEDYIDEQYAPQEEILVPAPEQVQVPVEVSKSVEEAQDELEGTIEGIEEKTEEVEQLLEEEEQEKSEEILGVNGDDRVAESIADRLQRNFGRRGDSEGEAEPKEESENLNLFE